MEGQAAVISLVTAFAPFLPVPDRQKFLGRKTSPLLPKEVAAPVLESRRRPLDSYLEAGGINPANVLSGEA